MDITRYLNSKDVREYLRKIEYKFTAAEAAWIVDRCEALPFEEKVEAWETIIKTMPDCRYVSPWDEDKVIESIHAAIKEYIDLKRLWFDEFTKEGERIYYEFNYKYEYNYPLRDFYIGRYSRFDECISNIKTDIKTGKDIFGYVIRKNEIDKAGCMYCWYSYDGKLLDVELTDFGDKKDEYYRISYLFTNMWPEFPMPFEKGDILRYVSAKGRCDQKLMVMTDLRPESKNGINDFGDEDKIRRLFGYFQNSNGTLYEKPAWTHYIDYELCPEETLKGMRKILISLSNYLKGKIPLECFVNDYHLIQLMEQIDDIRSEQLFSRASMDD